LTHTTMVYGKHLVADSDTVIHNGAVIYCGERILAVGSYDDMIKTYNPSTIYGSSEMLVAPGFINAHGHGRGLTDFQLGSTDDVLEAWKYRTYPGLDLYYDTLWRSIQMLESGITSTMHNHNLQNPALSMEEFHTAIDAYENAGIRVAFVPTLIDDNIVLYGQRALFMKDAPLIVRDLVETIEARTKVFSLSAYLQAIEELLASRRSDKVTILHGPLAPQWCKTESLQTIQEHAKSHRLRIHIHILQTILQKEFSRRFRTGSLVEDLAQIGLLGPQTTCGHAIWLTEKDIAILATTQSSVTTHSSCNLRIQSGLSPVRNLLKSGVKVAIGMDDKTFNDQKDFFTEMRLTARLHRLGAYEMLQSPLSSTECYRMSTQWGAEVLDFPHCGSLKPGNQADIILMNYEAMTYPYTYEGHNPLDVMLYRGKPDHIDTVIIAGKHIMKNRVFTDIDRETVIAKLRESIPADYRQRFEKVNSQYRPLKEALSLFYKKNGWYERANQSNSPYYSIHNRE
jgi:5-methylthioadenosine/S-adenosylhomocysteine deaminase